MDLSGKVAVITGAAGGIGRAIARSLAARGCHLALTDVNEEGLEETEALIGRSVRISRHKTDVADLDAVVRLPAEVVTIHGVVDILVNNAGVALGGSFAQISPEQFDWLLGINLMGVVGMSRSFLPLLAARPVAQLVNVSSIFGIYAAPGQTAYATSKFAVRGFSESLRHELRNARSSVAVTVVYPGGIRTDIVENAQVGSGVMADEAVSGRIQQRKTLRMSPEDAADIIVEAVARRRSRVLVGADAKLVALVERLLPVSHSAAIERLTSMFA
jgi:short-subunit dehydrogenase